MNDVGAVAERPKEESSISSIAVTQTCNLPNPVPECEKRCLAN